MSVDTAATDRLPWLSDDPLPPPRSRRGRGGLLPLGVATIATVAMGGFWLGSRGVENPARPASQHPQVVTTVQLPPPTVAAPEARTESEPKAEVRQAPVREAREEPAGSIHVANPPERHEVQDEAEARPIPTPQRVETYTQARPLLRPAAPPAAQFVSLAPWNPRVFAGAAGRVVQIGAFGSVHQAKRGWWYMARAYPAMTRLPAVVRDSRNSHGETFYRFQVGTTSQAHSEVLCQRMRTIGLSCAVVGLPWKAKVER
jgi:hypothetical protein